MSKCANLICLLCLSMILVACGTTEYVTLPEYHETHHHHTDSVIKHDSTIVERETKIMQLDSAAMAQYGITLKKAETAWLVKTKELERQLQILKEMRNDSVHKTDSVPYPIPYPVEKEVPRERGLLETLLLACGILYLGKKLILFIYQKIKKKYLRK